MNPATHPSIDPLQLERRAADGLIRMSTRDELTIYNYTETCTYGRHWDKYTLMARGLILDADGRVVAKPFSKFFNLGEPSCPSLPNLPYDVYEKVDGSLGIWYFYKDAWRVATRGSLANEYTAYAQQFAPLLADVPTHWTVMTEICMPADLDGMPRAVKHEPGLVYLGAVNRLSHDDINPRDQRSWPYRIAMRLNASIDDLLLRVKDTEGVEGWVIRFENGFRVKIKTAWYLQLFRAISNLTEKHVKELMTKAGLDEWLKDFPEELQDDAKVIYTNIYDRFVERRDRIMRDFAQYNHPDRKTFALSIKDHPEKGYLFTLYDQKSIDTRLIMEC
jgi:RNA ligase